MATVNEPADTVKEVSGLPALPPGVVARKISNAQWRTLFNLFPKAKPDMVLMVWDYCLSRGLDPMKKPCHIVQIEVQDPNGGYSKVDVVMPGIYEYRITAHRTGLYLGHSKPAYGPLVEIAGVLAPETCDLTVLRWHRESKTTIEFPVQVKFAECVATRRDGHANARWTKAPQQMLTKCFSSDTEVLTELGFQRFAAVAGARILQVTAHGRLEPVDAKPFAQTYDGPMVTLDSDDLNFCVTPNHDMVTTHGKIEAGVMFERSRARPKFWIPRILTGSNPEAPISDGALKLAAAYLADGSDHGSGFAIELSRARKVEAVRALGPLHFSESVGSRAGAVAHTATRDIVTKVTQTRFVFSHALVEPLVFAGKRVDLSFLLTLSRRQARIFVDTLVEFDGNVATDTGVRRFFTSRPNLLRAFEIACVMAGLTVNKPTERFSDISTKPNYSVTVSDRDAIPVRRVGRRYHRSVTAQEARSCLELTPNRSGDVWCVTVPSGVIVVRRNGFAMLCGNCTEAAGLREAFPEELGGEATAEERAGQRDLPDIDVTPIATEEIPTTAPRKSEQQKAAPAPPPVVDATIVETPAAGAAGVTAAGSPQTPASSSVPSCIGTIVDISESKGFTYVKLNTGFRCATKSPELIAAAQDAKKTSRRVELSTRPASDPVRFCPTLEEIASPDEDE